MNANIALPSLQIDTVLGVVRLCAFVMYAISFQQVRMRYYISIRGNYCSNRNPSTKYSVATKDSDKGANAKIASIEVGEEPRDTDS